MATDINLINTSRPIKNYGSTVFTSPTGLVVNDNSAVNTVLTISDIEQKYENKFVDRADSIVRSDHYSNVSIASGATTSDGFSIADYSFGSFEVRSVFTGPSVTFETRMRDGDWNTAYDSTGAALTGVAITTGTVTPFPSDLMYGDEVRFAAASGQVNDVDINVLLKG